MRPSRLLLAALALTTSAFAASPLEIHTDKGKVAGTLTADNQIRIFKGIPYAAPPVGPLRWQPPQPAAKWQGTLAATSFGHHCIQTNPFADMTFPDAGPSEDCLKLNIWTPANAHPGTLPVMVWIHGGGYTAGSASEPRHDGQFLARHNVIIVTLNYRLGIFGFFTHPALVAESPHHAAGNYGLLDQAAALAWVHRNIRAFGGDPANITVFGESAGSFSVSALMASPLSKALIAKAIGESGAAFHSSGLSFPTLTTSEQQGAAFAQSAFHTSSLADLRKLSPDDLLKAVTAKSTPPPPHFAPVVDGYFLPQSVPEIFAAGVQAHIPLLAGWNADEVRAQITLSPTPTTVATFTAQATKDFPTNSHQFLTVYPATTNAQALQSAGDFISDRFIAYSTWAWLEAQVKTGHAPVYRYRFDLAAPADKFHPTGTGAFHSDDIEYVFGTLDTRQPATRQQAAGHQSTIRPEDRTLSNQIQQYWTNFARTGNPNGLASGSSSPAAASPSPASGSPSPAAAQTTPTLPTWPTYNPPDWQVMHLNVPSQAHPDIQRPRYQFLDSVWSQPQ
jgi:para-nitrobenzyl esterase